MKIKITRRVKDLDTGDILKPGGIIEKDRKRGEKFLPYYGVEVVEDMKAEPRRKKKA